LPFKSSLNLWHCQVNAISSCFNTCFTMWSASQSLQQSSSTLILLCQRVTQKNLCYFHAVWIGSIYLCVPPFVFTRINTGFFALRAI
jgi:hypothetical protein